MKRLLWISALLFFLPQCLWGKVRVLIFHYNRPDFLEFQYQTFKKFVLDEDYELIIFNDAPNSKDEKSIQEICDKYKLQCVRYEQSWHENNPLNEWIRSSVDSPLKNSFFVFPLENNRPSPKAIFEQCSIRHCHVIQYALDHFGYNHDDIVVIMDADVFPIKPIKIRDLLIEYPLVGIDSEFKHMHYLWVPFIAFDPKRLPNITDLKFHLDFIEGILCDTGSHSYHYFKDNPGVPYQLYPRRSDNDFSPWDELTFLKFGFNQDGIDKISWPISMEFYIDYHFIHFVGGSGIPHLKKNQNFLDFIQCILK